MAKKIRKESPQVAQRLVELRKKGLVTPSEASVRTKTPLQTIYTWIRTGKLKCFRVGVRSVFVPIKEVLNLTTPSLSR